MSSTQEPHAEPFRTAKRKTSGLTLPDLVTKLFSDLSELFRKESELVRSELSDKATQLQAGVGKIAAGAIVLLVALIIMAQALVVAVANIITALSGGADGPDAVVVVENSGLASLIVGAVFSAVGAFLVRSGSTDLEVHNLAPDRTPLQIRRDAKLAKEQMR